MTTLEFVENPQIYNRGDNSIVLFPAKPYWFSATKEISCILEAFKLVASDLIVANISSSLGVAIGNAQEIFDDVSGMLFSSGVLAIDGQLAAAKEYSPDYQVNDVENVMVIATTQQCNLTCPMCYASAKRKMPGEMTTDQIKGIIDQLADMSWQNNVSRVALTGGELFLRPDAIELIEYVQQRGFFAQVNSNATLLTSSHVDRLSKIKRLKMSVSLDGCKRSSHEAIRGAGTYDVTVKNIRSLCKRGVSVAINMFIHADNIDEIGGTLGLADSLGAQGFNCLNMMNVGRGNSQKTKQLLTEVPLAIYYRKIFETIRNNQRFQELMMGSTFANQIMGIAGGVKSHGCGLGTNRAVYIKADGTLYPCADTALPAFVLGKLTTDSLSDIWKNSPVLKELRTLNIDTMNEKCSACDVRYWCAGNCRGENYQTTKNIKSPHFKCEQIHDSVLELMWILTEDPELFKCKVDKLYETVSTHASTA